MKKEKLKVLEVLPGLNAGGAESLASHLSIALAKSGVEVKILLMAGVRDKRGEKLLSFLQKTGIEVIGIDTHKAASFANFFRLARLICSWKPNIVHAHLYCSEVTCAVAKILTMGRKCKYFRTLHCSKVDVYGSHFLLKMLDRFFDVTIGCSSFATSSYYEFLAGKPKSKVLTIPNGCFLPSSNTTANEKSSARKTLKIASDAFVLVNIAGYSCGTKLSNDAKGHDVMLKAFTKAFGCDDRAVLLCAGDGPLKEEVELLAGRLGIGKQTQFLGAVAEPWVVLQAADICFIPSRYEGLPLVPLEAASLGLPIVTSDIPEIRSLHSGNAWIFCPVDDAAAFAVALTEIRKNLEEFAGFAAKQAIECRDKYSIGKCAASYMEAFCNETGTSGVVAMSQDGKTKIIFKH